MISIVSLIVGAALKEIASTQTSPPSPPRCSLIQECGSRKRDAIRRGGRAPEPRGEREEGMEGKEEVGFFAPVSTTGILGLIIQMWMLLLENTRSRVEALSSTWDQRQTLFSPAQWQKLINV